ncbi:MAG: hypothetical protein ACXACB_03330 [Promethearchaeota archaeon]|jgi:hypothetical protein
MSTIEWWKGLKEKSIAFPLTKPPVTNTESFEVIRGFFIASKIRWEEIQKKIVDPTKYYGIDSNSKKIKEQNQVAVYPFKKFLKIFKNTIPIEVCINLDINSVAGKDIKSYVSHYLEKNKALAYNTNNIIDWLKGKTRENALFLFVEFKINCSIDIKTYDRNNPRILPENKEVKIEKLITENFDRIAEQKVYPDFYEAFNENQKYSLTTAETQMKETTKKETKTSRTSKIEEQTELTSISKQNISPFSYYLSKNSEAPELKSKNFIKLKFSLGNKIELTAKITEEIERSKTTTKFVPKPELTVDLAKINSQSKSTPSTQVLDLRYRLVLDSDYFTFEPKINQLDKNNECKLTISPNIEKLTAEEKKDDGYVVKLQLIDTKYNVTYPQKQIKIKLIYPDLEIELNRPNLPHKGWPIDLTFTVTANLDSDIPLTLKGKLSPDFFVVNPPAFDEAKKGEITQTHKIKTGKPTEKKIPFTIKASRAGHWPWFRNEAYFQFSIGKWNLPIKQKEFSVGPRAFGKLKEGGGYWKMRMNVYPSWFDTLISGFAGIYLLLIWYYPEWSIPITANLNFSTLALPSSAIYLAYRLINWGRTLQSGAKEKE